MSTFCGCPMPRGEGRRLFLPYRSWRVVDDWRKARVWAGPPVFFPFGVENGACSNNACLALFGFSATGRTRVPHAAASICRSSSCADLLPSCWQGAVFWHSSVLAHHLTSTTTFSSYTEGAFLHVPFFFYPSPSFGAFSSSCFHSTSNPALPSGVAFAGLLVEEMQFPFRERR
ncbi:hypothetical protein BCY84_18174 [Trypanosoma cruzi cruzi]|nr:hypothetical protein BCY84_18174 [Trypanosoma cruzi cruzi]